MRVDVTGFLVVLSGCSRIRLVVRDVRRPRSGVESIVRLVLTATTGAHAFRGQTDGHPIDPGTARRTTITGRWDDHR